MCASFFRKTFETSCIVRIAEMIKKLIGRGKCVEHVLFIGDRFARNKKKKDRKSNSRQVKLKNYGHLFRSSGYLESFLRLATFYTRVEIRFLQLSQSISPSARVDT